MRLVAEKAARMILKLMKINHARHVIYRQKQNNAATRLQSFYRMRLAIKKRLLLRKVRAATKIQSLYRCFKAKKLKKFLRYRLQMIKRIQVFWRTRFRGLVKKIVKIQSLARMLKAKRARDKIIKYNRSVLKIQCAWRGKSARLVLGNLRAQHAKKKLNMLKLKRVAKAWLIQHRNNLKIKKAFR